MDGDGINDNAFQEQNQNRKQMTGPANGSSRQMGTPEVKTPGQQEQKKGQKGKKD